MKYRFDMRATRAEILRSPEVVELVNDRADAAVDYVKRQVAAADFKESTGDYERSIVARKRTRAGDRYGAVVTATAPYAQRLEQKHHLFAGVIDYVEQL